MAERRIRGVRLSREERLDKVWGCMSRVLAEADGATLLGLLEELEDVADISTVMAIVGQTPGAR